MSIVHLFLDFDGTIVNSEEIGIRADFALIRSRGVNISFDQLSKEYLNFSVSDFAKVLEAHCPGQYDWKSDLELTYATSLRKNIRSQVGVAEFIENLIIPFSIATNSSLEQLGTKLNLAGLPSGWAHNAVTSEQISLRKPNPETYEVALGKFGVRANDVLAIEDSIQGVKSAALAGIRTIGFSGSVHSADQLLTAGAVETFDSWLHVSPLLLSLS